MTVTNIPFESYKLSVPRILDKTGANKDLKNQTIILVKPNLVNDSPFPVTTAREFTREVILYIQKHSTARIILAEGCGDAVLETDEVFQNLCYDSLARELNIELLDLNHATLEKRTDPDNGIFLEIFLPEIAGKSYIVSLPVLKAHSLARLTGTLKNMMGFAPPSHDSGKGFWKKAFFHDQMQKSISELNRYILPDLTLMDASVGLAQYHLGEPMCDPPANRLLAGFDPFLLDQTAARLLGLDPEGIPHICSPAKNKPIL
jgi:uncharacterized protein (DUF362 family)